MSTIPDVCNFQSHVGSQFVLNAQVDRIGKARHQGMWIRIDEPEKRTGIDAGTARLKYAGIAAIPVEWCADAIRALVLGCKGVRDHIELGRVGRQEGEAEGAADNPLAGR